VLLGNKRNSEHASDRHADRLIPSRSAGRPSIPAAESKARQLAPVTIAMASAARKVLVLRIF